MENPLTRKVRYELIDHTADFGIQVRGLQAADLFENAALALFDLIAEAGRPQKIHTRRVRIAGNDWEDLMVNWLGELLYLWAGEGRLVREVTVESVHEREIAASVDCEMYSPERHVLKNEIKAVTYHQIQVVDTGEGWEARVILDV